MGLSQAHGFAKQSGGEIDVESRVGEGTTFTLYLPIANAEQIAASHPIRVARDVQTKTHRVLLVEDNEAVGQFARLMLEELGQIVTLVENGEAALTMLTSAPGKFDLVFSDVIMPGINGLDLARTIAMRWPGLEVVLTSGYSDVLAQEGCHGFKLLRKPYSLSGLISVLHGEEV